MVKEDILEYIKKSIKAEKLLIGKSNCMKLLKSNKLEKVFLASNCPADTLEDFEHYSKLQGVEVDKLDIANDELGMLCKRQHSICVLGILK